MDGPFLKKKKKRKKKKGKGSDIFVRAGAWTKKQNEHFGGKKNGCR